MHPPSERAGATSPLQLLDELREIERELHLVTARLVDVARRLADAKLILPAPAQADEFLTVAGVARLLKVDEKTVRGWISYRGLRSVKLGDATRRIRRSALEEWIERGGGA